MSDGFSFTRHGPEQRLCEEFLILSFLLCKKQLETWTRKRGNYRNESEPHELFIRAVHVGVRKEWGQAGGRIRKEGVSDTFANGSTSSFKSSLNRNVWFRAPKQEGGQYQVFCGCFWSYLQRLHLVLQPLVLGVQVFDAVLGLAQLGLQLGLQLSAPLLELQQLLLGLLTAVMWAAIRQQEEVSAEPGAMNQLLQLKTFSFIKKTFSCLFYRAAALTHIQPTKLKHGRRFGGFTCSALLHLSGGQRSEVSLYFKCRCVLLPCGRNMIDCVDDGKRGRRRRRKKEILKAPW